MNKKVKKAIKNYNKKLSKRLKNTNEERTKPMFTASTIKHELSNRNSAISFGGIGLVHNLMNAFDFTRLINENVNVLKCHKPYFESDHILNLVYNLICGGTCIEDIELLRNSIPYMDGLGTGRIPDPTTAGDFLRRFKEKNIHDLIWTMNEMSRVCFAHTLGERERSYGIIDTDGKIQKTYGECKEKMDMSYKGVWGFSTLILTEATTGVHVSVVNRPGNALSQEGAVEHMDKAIDEMKKTFAKIYMRGDSAFSLTWKFDEWTEEDVGFIFGYDRHWNLLEIAENLPEKAWKRLDKRKKASKKTRKKKERVKAAQIIKRKYKTKTQKAEYVSEFNYRPTKCDRDYRVIVVKKDIEVTEGQALLFDDEMYLFYITNIGEMDATELVEFIRGRCNHENKIEQMANGIHALKMPTAEFLANWAYMVIAALAWNIKSYLGILIPDKNLGRQIIACEFKAFQNRLINIPCQILKTGRKIVYRYLDCSQWIETLFSIFDILQKLRPLRS